MKQENLSLFIFNLIPMATLIKHTGETFQVYPVNDTDFQLKELYYHLECHIIEVLHLEDGRIMIVDQNSKQAEDWQVNIIATEEYRKDRMTNEQMCEYLKQLGKTYGAVIDAREDTLVCVAGNVLICEKHEFL